MRFKYKRFIIIRNHQPAHFIARSQLKGTSPQLTTVSYLNRCTHQKKRKKIFPCSNAFINPETFFSNPPYPPPPRSLTNALKHFFQKGSKSFQKIAARFDILKSDETTVWSFIFHRATYVNNRLFIYVNFLFIGRNQLLSHSEQMFSQPC